MKLALFILPLVAATPIAGVRRWSSYSYGSEGDWRAPAPQKQPAQPEGQEQPAPAPRPAVYQNSTDWWVAGSVLHGKWREGQWDGVDNTAGAWMYVDERGVAVTIVPI